MTPAAADRPGAPEGTTRGAGPAEPGTSTSRNAASRNAASRNAAGTNAGSHNDAGSRNDDPGHSDAGGGVPARIRRTGAVAILRLREHGNDLAVAQALLRGGLDVMEVTLDHPDGIGSVHRLAAGLPDTALVGAGTVLTTGQVRDVARAGGRFCVSPHTDPALIAEILRAGLEPVPGATTPTEIAAARAAGARLVKLFPAGPLGTGYLRAISGPLHDVAFVPTGGIRHDEVQTWLRAGGAAVGLGSDLVPQRPGAADARDIEWRARTVCAQVRAARLAR